MSVARGTVHSIQFLRFVAAMLVVIFHAHLGYTSQLHIDSPLVSQYLFRFGAVGVHIFFVISGYIMYLTNFDRAKPFSTRSFLARRLVRIYPTYWLFVGLYLAGTYALGIMPQLNAGDLAGVLALAPGDAPLVIGPAWTLAYEVFFYIAFGMVMRWGARRGTVALSAMFLAAAALGALWRPANAMLALVTNSLLLEFVAGMWIARLTGLVPWRRRVGWAALAAGIAGFVAGLGVGYFRMPSVLAWGVPSALVIAGAVILEQTRAAHPGAEPGGFVRRFSVLGDSSYSLYLCHLLLITLGVAAARASGWVPPLTLLVGATAVFALAFAEVFYRLVERRMVGMLHRLIDGSARQRPLERVIAAERG